VTGHSPIEAALGRHPLAEVARRTGIPLNTGTGSVTVRCPLPSHGHADRTPSMRLYLDDDRYYCFGCAAKGDVIQWARETEGVGVTAAIAVLDSGSSLTNAWAGTASATGGSTRPWGAGVGTPLLPKWSEGPETPDPARTPAERVLATLDAAWGYYSCPSLHARASAYLAGRGIKVRVLEAHTGRAEAGHTPARADGLVAAMRARGFIDDELVDAGLAHRYVDSEPVSDFYRQRVLIPIRDDQQRVVGIIGRNLGDQQRWAKYKNPPRTAVYDKSVNLYQPLAAPADPHGAVIVVEGTLDAMAIAIAAVRTGQSDQFCPVTQSGRELSPAQLARVIGLHPAPPILGFDGDRAGQEAACRHALAAARRGRTLGVTLLPGCHDPASWLAKQGDDGLKAWARHKVPAAGRPAPVPVDAATYVAGYIAQQGLGRVERMKVIGAAAEACRGMPGHSAQRWTSCIEKVLGRTGGSTTPIPVSTSTASTDWVVGL